jgi:alkylation response protein AidB-like acyl-CoA dehydrogenase
MDLTWSDADLEFQAQARDWLRANAPGPLPSGDTREGFAEHVAWEQFLNAEGWSVVTWPRAFGGRDASHLQGLLFDEEYHRAGAPQRVTQNGLFLLAPTLFAAGTQEQRERILPPMAAARELWCQAWSEPGAGSDLAALTSRATRDDDRGGWVLNGQKTWSTRGAFCTHAFGLFRSGPAGRHRDLTYVMVALDAPGVTVRGFDRLDGDEGFADLFLDDVFVPDRDVIGRAQQGWRVAMTTASNERGLTLRPPGRFLAAVDRLRDLIMVSPAGADPALRQRLVECWLDARSYELHTLASVADLEDGGELGARASVAKLHWSTLDIRLHELALDVLGPLAQQDREWTRGFLFSLAGPIYAGTNEIQRDIVAEKLLGMPRSR